MINVVITDVDGCLTTGRFFYDATGKRMKEFGPHDSDGLKMLREANIGVVAITADLNGWDISFARCKDMGIPLYHVSEENRDVWLSAYDADETAYIGDGIHDVPGLFRFKRSFAPADACASALNAANEKLHTKGGHGVLLEVALRLIKYSPPPERWSPFLRVVLNEIRRAEVHPDKINDAIAYLATAEHQCDQVIGLAAGRMGFALRGFIMRLSHYGFGNAYMIGDPGIRACNHKTLVIVNSSSGETPSIKLLAQQAKDLEAGIFTVTASPSSTIAQMSNFVLPYEVPPSVQPMKSLHEQFTALIFDALMLGLKGTRDLSKNHSSLE